jgi:uncharacterized protein YprB with RNaseH-like and TPR domain
LLIQYICRKCGEKYSKQEYDQSRFCLKCGSFLLPTITSDTLRTPNPAASFTESATQTNVFPEEKLALRRVAESLRQKVVSTKEYTVIAENEDKPLQTEHSAAEGWIWNTEYTKALELKSQLLDKYKNIALADAIAGKIVSNEQGECYAVSSTCVSNFKTAAYEESRRLIISDLKIIPGIGPSRERVLKQQGYMTIEDLKAHPLWGRSAQNFMELIEKKQLRQAQNWLGQRLPKSHPLAHYLAGFCKNEDFAIVDIETLGLSERPIILLGVAKPRKNRFCVSQFLLRDIQDEPSAIHALVSLLDSDSSLITFNGKSFDIPYIKQRLAYYGLDASLDHPNFDVLHFTRRAFKKKLADCRLETVEKYMGIQREIDIPGALVPNFYDTYLTTGNVGPLVAIVEHNKQDLITLGKLFCRLYEEWNL